MLMYERAGIRVYLGDCRVVMREFERESFDLLVTDPPYGIGYRSGTRAKQFDVIAGDDDAAWVPAMISQAGLLIRRDRHAYVFGSFGLEEFPIRMKAKLVWDKVQQGSGDLASQWGSSHEEIMFCTRASDRNKKNMNGGAVPARLRSGSILKYPRPNARQVNRHPTEKPVALLRRLIESSSFPGETVLDPCVGCGSTLVAAVAEGRCAVGVEIDPGYVGIAVRRVDAAIDAYENLMTTCR